MNQYTKYSLLIIGFFAVLYFSFLTPIPQIFGDHALYMNLAQAIGQGVGFRDICYPNNPPHQGFTPPLFPFILSPILSFFGYSPLILKTLLILFGLSSLVMLYFLLREVSDEKTAIIVLIPVGISSYMVRYMYYVLPEVVYIFFSTTTLFFLVRRRKSAPFAVVVIFLSALLSFLTRYVGITLIIAVLISLFIIKSEEEFSKYNKKIIVGLFLIAMTALFMLYKDTIVGTLRLQLSLAQHSLTMDDANIFARILKNIYALVFYAAPANLTGIEFIGRSMIALIFSFLCLVGFFYSLIKRRTSLEFYMGGYLLLLMFYAPFSMHGTRYLMPIIAFSFFYYSQSLKILSHFLKFNIYPLGVVLILLVNLFSTYNYLFITRKEEEKKGRQLMETARFIDKSAASDDIIATINPDIIYLFTETKTIFVPFESPQFADKILRNASYLVCEPFSLYTTKKFLLPLIAEHQDRLDLIYKDGDFKLYKIK